MLPTRAAYSRHALRITRPGSEDSLIFSHPVNPGQSDVSDVLWLKLEVESAVEDGFGSVRETIADFTTEPTEAMIVTDLEAWSPDGRIFTLCRAVDVNEDGEYRTQVLLFVDAALAMFANFVTSTGSATTDNCTGWNPTKPHELIVRRDLGGFENAVLNGDEADDPWANE